MLWRDGDYTVNDAVVVAKRMGFFHVYTNGTWGFDTPADMVWVSMDGLPGTFELRRGNHINTVEQAVRKRDHPKAAIIYVIDRNTAGGMEPFLELKFNRRNLPNERTNFTSPSRTRDSGYDPQPFAARVNELLKKNKESDREAALSSGLDHQAVRRILAGQQSFMTNCILLADHFRVNPND